VKPWVILGFRLNSDPSADDLSVEELDPKQLCTLWLEDRQQARAALAMITSRWRRCCRQAASTWDLEARPVVGPLQQTFIQNCSLYMKLPKIESECSSNFEDITDHWRQYTAKSTFSLLLIVNNNHLWESIRFLKYRFYCSSVMT